MRPMYAVALSTMLAACSGNLTVEGEFSASSEPDDEKNTSGRGGSSSSGTSGSRAGNGGSTSQPRAGASGGEAGSTGGAGEDGAGAGGVTAPSGNGGGGSGGTRPPFMEGPSGLGSGDCGLAEPAFCDYFDKPFTSGGRMGELDPARWSGGRVQPNLPSGAGRAMPIPQATLPTCRSGLPAKVFPDQDTVICDPQPGTSSNHLLFAVAAQNYGQNSYRIRQPFDFADRTGTIVFDADPGLPEGIGPPGWISVEVTEDPVSVPSYALFQNDEGGAKPRNGFEIQIRRTEGSGVSSIGAERLHVFKDHVGTDTPCDGEMFKVRPGHFNRFELRVSPERVSLAGSDFSADGTTFGALKELCDLPLDVDFTRGYVHITMHNHASEKYAQLDAVVSRWDNVGFDGPVVSNWREYDVPNSERTSGGEMDVGYTLCSNEPAPMLTFPGVDLGGASSAKLSATVWYLVQDEPADAIAFRYRLNGKAWRDHVLTAGEATSIEVESLGAVEHVVDVPIADLVAGDNRLELQSANTSTNYCPVAANITLVLATE